MKADTVLGKTCKVGRKEFTIIGYIVWSNKIQYVWIGQDDLIKFTEVEIL